MNTPKLEMLLAMAQDDAGEFLSGKCRVCGCTPEHPCAYPALVLPLAPPEFMFCVWIDPEMTLCSNPRCVAMIPLEKLIRMCVGA